MIDKYDLLARLRYSSQYSDPCPEWVYKAIEAMPDVSDMESRKTSCGQGVSDVSCGDRIIWPYS